MSKADVLDIRGTESTEAKASGSAAVLTHLPLQDTSLDIWDKKYRLKTKDGLNVDDTVEDTFARVAKALSEVEKTVALRDHWQQEFLWALKQGAIPAGRITSNAGALAHKPATSTINCTVSGTIVDSMDDILGKVHEAGLTLKAGCGIGYDFSTLRPRGAYVSGAGAYTSGPLSFMDIFDKMCFTVSSAGGRRGAQMGTFDVRHPDVLEFIKAKREDGRLRQFNLSLLITEDFIQAVKADEQWQLAFPIRSKELDDGDVQLDDPDQIVWRDWPSHENVVANEEGLVACRIYRTMPARRLWDLIMSSTYDFAEPGFILIDKVNEMNNNWFDETIRATNPCVTSDTWVQTDNGPKRVADLVGKPFKARVDGVDHASGQTGFFRTATKPVIRLDTREGHSLRLTDDHRVRRIARFDGVGYTTEWCAAGQLHQGDRVLLNDHRSGAQWTGVGSLAEGSRLGHRAGLSVSVSSGSAGIGASGQINRSANPAQTGGMGQSAIALAEGPAIPRATTVPEFVERSSSDFHVGYLRGLFDAAGSIVVDAWGFARYRLGSSQIETLRSVQRMLLRVGIASTVHRKQKELVVSGANVTHFCSAIGTNTASRRAALDAALESHTQHVHSELFTAVVSSIREDGIEDVYDVKVPGINTFDANGLHAHNCGEQPLPPYGACLLGSVNLTRFVHEPFTDRAHFDWARYTRTVEIFTRMLDNVVEINGLPLKQQQKEIVRKRRHGMGYLGLGSTLTLLGMKYGSPESLDFTDKVTRELAVTGWRTSLELSKEKGPAPIMDEDFTVTGSMLRQRPEMKADGYSIGDTVPGRILHARYSRYMQRIAEVDPALVDELAEVGARFTHHSSIAPTGTISLSLANNASNGIEPSFAHLYSRNVIREGRKTKEKVDVLSYELLAYRAVVNANADPYTEDEANKLPECFVAADDIRPSDHISIQAASQHWIDSSISKTANVPTDFAFEEFKDIYMDAYDQGLKGCTTFRFNPENFQGVLVKEADLENTKYQFTLDDGSIVEVKGNEEIEYDGEMHTAANLYDALKEGYYGKF